jgi:hypothetical protein
MFSRFSHDLAVSVKEQHPVRVTYNSHSLPKHSLKLFKGHFAKKSPPIIFDMEIISHFLEGDRSCTNYRYSVMKSLEKYEQ